MSQHHAKAKWTSVNQKHRARIAAALPAACIRCGGIITAEMRWDVGHRVDLALGGDANDVGPEHRSCNRRAGGRAGARVSHANRRTNQRDDRLPNW